MNCWRKMQQQLLLLVAKAATPQASLLALL
jgi:hypothetical protein